MEHPRGLGDGWDWRATRIISGAQVGSDMGGLFAGEQLGLVTGGWAPVDFMTAKGPRPWLAEKFNVRAIERTPTMRGVGYKKRDRLNVDMCNAFVAFIVSQAKTGRGTLSTMNYARTGRYKYVDVDRTREVIVLNSTATSKPAFVSVDLTRGNLQRRARAIARFLASYRPRNLMIAGSICVSEADVRDVLVAAFGML